MQKLFPFPLSTHDTYRTRERERMRKRASGRFTPELFVLNSSCSGDIFSHIFTVSSHKLKQSRLIFHLLTFFRCFRRYYVFPWIFAHRKFPINKITFKKTFFSVLERVKKCTHYNNIIFCIIHFALITGLWNLIMLGTKWSWYPESAVCFSNCIGKWVDQKNRILNEHSFLLWLLLTRLLLKCWMHTTFYLAMRSILLCSKKWMNANGISFLTEQEKEEEAKKLDPMTNIFFIIKASVNALSFIFLSFFMTFSSVHLMQLFTEYDGCTGSIIKSSRDSGFLLK